MSIKKVNIDAKCEICKKTLRTESGFKKHMAAHDSVQSSSNSKNKKQVSLRDMDIDDDDEEQLGEMLEFIGETTLIKKVDEQEFSYSSVAHTAFGNGWMSQKVVDKLTEVAEV